MQGSKFRNNRAINSDTTRKNNLDVLNKYVSE